MSENKELHYVVEYIGTVNGDTFEDSYSFKTAKSITLEKHPVTEEEYREISRDLFRSETTENLVTIGISRLIQVPEVPASWEETLSILKQVSND